MKMEPRHLTILGGAVLAAGLSSVAWAGDPVIYDNGLPDWAMFGSPASQLDTAYPFDAGAADDFILGHSGQGDGSWNITDVHWSGVYFSGDATSPGSFNIIFWPDAGGMPAGGQALPNGPDYSQALAIYNIAGDANQTIDPAGDGVLQFSYWVDLPVPFVAAANTAYWVEVQPVFSFPPQWAFQRTAAQVNGAPAAQGFAIRGIPGVPYWSPAGGGADPMDLSFSLTGTPVPAPGVLALLGVAGLAGMRRHRRK